MFDSRTMSSLLYRLFPEARDLAPGLDYWRIRIVFALGLAGVALGLPALIPSAALAAREGMWSVVAMDIAAYLMVIAAMLGRGLPYKMRAGVMAGVTYLLGAALSITLGLEGAGLVWLFAFPVLCGLLIGPEASAGAMIMNAAVILFTAWLASTGRLAWARETPNAVHVWLVVGLNVMILNAAVAIAASLLLRGLRKAVEQERSALAGLNEKAAELRMALRQVQDEVEVRRRTEEDLRRSRELTLELLKYSAVPGVVFDASGMVQSVNLAFTETFGWTEGDFERPEDWPDKVEPEKLDLADAPPRNKEAGESLLARKDGDAAVVVRREKYLPDGRRHVQVLDVTERARAEQERTLLETQLRQAQKMEAVGNLAGGIAHDFNNILTVVMGLSQIMVASVDEGGELRRPAEEIAKAAEKGAVLTRRLLAFSRRQVVQPRIVDINAVVAEMQHMMQRLIGEDVRLEIKPAPRIWKVKADPGQIDQVVMNLAANARDAMPGGGVITLRTSNVHLDDAALAGWGLEAPAGDYILLAVSDTGQGMTRETLGRIFEPFFTTKEPGRGTGLGLPTVYGIVEQAGGFIRVSSEPGGGAVFKVYFPRAEEVPAGEEPLDEEPDGLEGGETILAAEDDDMVRRVIVRTLARRGYTVLEARDGAEALQILQSRESPVDLVLADAVMPGISGRDLADRLQRNHPETGVIFVSGYVDDDDFRKVIPEEGADYLEKPFNPQELARRVRRVLDRRRKKG